MIFSTAPSRKFIDATEDSGKSPDITEFPGV